MNQVIGSKSHFAKMSGDDYNEHPRLAGADSSSSEPARSPRRKGMGRARAAPRLNASVLDAILVTSLVAIDSSDQGGTDVEVDRRGLEVA